MAYTTLRRVAITADGRVADQSMARIQPQQGGITWVTRPANEQLMTGQQLYGAGSGAQRGTVSQSVATTTSTANRTGARTAVPAGGVSRQAGSGGGGGTGGFLYLRNAQQVAGSNAVNAGQVGAGGVSWAAVRPAEIGTNDILRELESQALTDVGLGGQLSAQEQRDAQQAARGAFASRGMAYGNPAVAAEILGRDEFARQRQAERRAFAGGISGMLQERNQEQAQLDQQAALENSRGQMQVALQNVQDQMRVAIANQDDSRARALANQEERLRRDLGFAEAQLGAMQIAVQQQQLALDRERAADASQQWRTELSSREAMAGQDANTRRELSQMEIDAGIGRQARDQAAGVNDFFLNKAEANRIDRNNWNRWNGGGVGGVRQSPRNFQDVGISSAAERAFQHRKAFAWQGW